MSVIHQQIRVGVINDIGADLDDQLETLKVEVRQQEGAKAAYQTAAKLIEQLLPRLQEEIGSGKISLETGSEASKWIQRAAGVCESLHIQATQGVVAKSGAIAHAEKTIHHLKKKMDAERSKLVEMERELLTQPAPTDDVGDGRQPPRSIKEVRQAEEAAATKPAPRKRGKRVSDS